MWRAVLIQGPRGQVAAAQVRQVPYGTEAEGGRGGGGGGRDCGSSAGVVQHQSRQHSGAARVRGAGGSVGEGLQCGEPIAALRGVLGAEGGSRGWGRHGSGGASERDPRRESVEVKTEHMRITVKCVPLMSLRYTPYAVTSLSLQI